MPESALIKIRSALGPVVLVEAIGQAIECLGRVGVQQGVFRVDLDHALEHVEIGRDRVFSQVEIGFMIEGFNTTFNQGDGGSNQHLVHGAGSEQEAGD